ncbi:MAG TPA: hypothetical protein VGG45_20205 [Terracidiphilus sp.]|jgi:hypothetical protein
MSIDLLIWLACLLAQIAVIGLLLYRGVWRTLPFFCVYCIWDILGNVSVFLVGQYHQASYFQAYFIEVAVDAALMFGVLVEVAWSVLRPLRASLPRGAVALIGVLILVAGAAIWPFAALPGLEHATTRAGLLFTQLEQTSSILRVLLFLVLAGGSQLLSIGWRDRELQVATGLGIYSIVGLTVAVIGTHQTTEAQYFRLSEILSMAYLFCSIYWVVSFAQKEAERREFTPQMRNFLLAAAGGARSTRIAMSSDSGKDKPLKRDDR